MKLSFTEENIQKLFGNEAAEDETFERLQSYYIKNHAHDKVAADLPLRILVGHKGIGKSAIFKILRGNDAKSSRLAILIKPDDIADLGKNSTGFLQTIRDWKQGLMNIIAEKALSSVGLLVKDGAGRSFLNITGQVTAFLSETFRTKISQNISLDATQKKIIEGFLKSNKISIYIDDLDRGWESKKEDIMRISALLNAARDLSNDNSGLCFKISLRTDVYHLVRTSDESTDKIEGSVIWHSWSNHEILLMLIKRIKTFYGEDINIDILRNIEQRNFAYHMDRVFERKFEAVGKWERAPMYQVIMSFIRKRPRDLVKLCTLAARDAYNKNYDVIKTDNFIEIFEEYSQGRMQDTINEFRTELPMIERLLFGMKPNQQQMKQRKTFIYTTAELHQKLFNISQLENFQFRNGNKASVQDLSQFLFKINFITARKVIELEEFGETRIMRKYFEENRYLSSKFADFGFDWEVHPAFRWVLQGDKLNVGSSIELTADDSALRRGLNR